MGENTSWADLNRDGRRMERLIRDMETKYKNTDNHDLKMAYFDRLDKATNTKMKLAEIVLGVKKLLRKAEKVYV